MARLRGSVHQKRQVACPGPWRAEERSAPDSPSNPLGPTPRRDSPSAMGAYLSSPDTRKESESGTLQGGWKFGVSSMQGWRRTQEDAHIVHELRDGTMVL